MTDRDRLIELLKKDNCPSPFWCDEKCKYKNLKQCYEARTADYLIANGVIVPPCKVGDKVYVIYAGYVATAKVLALYIDREGGMFDLQIKTKDETAVGFKTVIDKDNYAFSDVFLTEEEAKKALESSNDDE